MSEKSDKNWSFFFKVLSYVATAIASFFGGAGADSLTNIF